MFFFLPKFYSFLEPLANPPLSIPCFAWRLVGFFSLIPLISQVVNALHTTADDLGQWILLLLFPLPCHRRLRRCRRRVIRTKKVPVGRIVASFRRTAQ